MSDPTRCVFCGHLPDTCDCSQDEYEDDFYDEYGEPEFDDDYEGSDDDDTPW